MSRLFNRLTGYAPSTTYQRLLIAPEYLRDSFLELMDTEIQAAKAGKSAHLILKMNQLEEDKIILKLYEASMAGVKVDLIVRGVCCLRPGVSDLSDNIRVISIVGRFLEHSRIYYFKNAPPEQQIYCGSADLMRRNLRNRVEVVYPILDADNRALLLRLLKTQLKDNVGAWEMLPDGSYQQIKAKNNKDYISSQKIFMKKGSFGAPE